MMLKDEITQVNSPFIEASLYDYIGQSGYMPGLIYSVYLPNGMVITSPDKFSSVRQEDKGNSQDSETQHS